MLDTLGPEHLKKVSSVSSVAIVGAGAAGLACAKELLESNNEIKIIVFERSDSLGGTWRYEPTSNPPLSKQYLDSLQQPDSTPWLDYLKANGTRLSYSAIYENLHTNLPNDIMAFPDFQFPPGTPVFPPHHVILEYLKSYSSHFHISDLIQFNTTVTDVVWVDNKEVASQNKGQWKVETLQNDQSSVGWFDAVVVASGHYDTPYIPSFPGLDQFPGVILHSHDYRTSDQFKNKHVIVVGGGHSGIDIAREISLVASQVFISLKDSDLAETLTGLDHYDRITILNEISTIQSNGSVMLVDNTTSPPVDFIILSTGYLFDFPFLTSLGGRPKKQGIIDNTRHPNLVTNGSGVHNLYKWQFYIHNPTLCFVGLPLKICPFPLFSVQATWMADVWNGKSELPSEEKMREDFKMEIKDNQREYMTLIVKIIEETLFSTMENPINSLDILSAEQSEQHMHQMQLLNKLEKKSAKTSDNQHSVLTIDSKVCINTLGLAIEKQPKCGAAISKNNLISLVVGNDIYLLNENCTKHEATINFDESQPELLAFNRNSSFLVVGDTIGSIHFIHCTTKSILFSFDVVELLENNQQHPNENDSEILKWLDFVSGSNDESEELIVVTKNMVLLRFSNVCLSKIEEAVLKKDFGKAKEAKKAIKMETVFLSDGNLKSVKDLAFLPKFSRFLEERIFVVGSGDSPLSVWSRSQPNERTINVDHVSKIFQESSQDPEVFTLVKCEIDPSGCYLLLLDNEFCLSLWDLR
ncbi:hypothetical protein HK096_003594, partial [Nowakowskiella sp. JEL0078]